MKLSRSALLLGSLALPLALGPGAQAAAPTSAPPRTVQVAAQLDGVAAKLGETFTLGKGSPLNFTLLKAEYDVGRVVMGNTVYFAKATALGCIPASAGTFAPLQAFDLRFGGATFTGKALNGKAPAPSCRYLTAVFTLKNPLGTEQPYAWSDFKPTLKDADGKRVAYNRVMLKASRDERVEGRLPGGEEVRVRFFFDLPANEGVESLSVTDAGGRAYVYDQKDLK
ncbi:hypothetical protein [Deinococcus hopiensis]|uniref:DUF3108 domain-containing protein n=1 Tax=Deinococcus hopiensis KR-140 TaxID=695939 RepID=A0A1W1UQX5_9DEIO|nr:hypothetical protein [Deinococcus hopiensis]SMB83211.1 hypothetical protein SAMN00790413_04308 [Deinococcus hopiensis KR-140]